MSATYHFAFSGVVDSLSSDVSLLVDTEEDGPVTGRDLAEKLTLFLTAVGWPEVSITIE